MVVGPQVHFKEGHAGGGGAGVRVLYTEEQLGFGAGILSFHAGGLVLPFRWFECGSQQLLTMWYFPSMRLSLKQQFVLYIISILTKPLMLMSPK